MIVLCLQEIWLVIELMHEYCTMPRQWRSRAGHAQTPSITEYPVLQNTQYYRTPSITEHPVLQNPSITEYPVLQNTQYYRTPSITEPPVLQIFNQMVTW